MLFPFMGIVNHKREAISAMIPNMGKQVVAILADNLQRNIGPGRRFATILELESKSKVGKSTIDRIRKGETSAGIENLEAIAHAFGLQPWQLLISGLDPNNPPRLRGEDLDNRTREMIGLFEQLDVGQKDLMLSTLRAMRKQNDQRKSRTNAA